MEAKVTVLTPNGRRQIVKVTPNTTILQILEEVCKKHGFVSDEFCLRHHNKDVPLSQIFRFSGLPNNCLLEMHPIDKKRTAEPVEICVQTEDYTRKQSKFSPDDNIWYILEQLLGKTELQKLKSPVVIYLRQEILGEKLLSNTTLKSLGILGGGALLHLVDRQPEILKTQAMVYKSPEPKNEPKESENNKPKTPKSVLPGGSGFAITKNLVQSLKKSSKKESDDKGDEKPTTSALSKDEQITEADKPKYDWGSAPGRSIRNSEMHTQEENNDNVEPEVEPEYHILGERNALIYSLDSSSNQIEDLPESFYDLNVNDLKLILRDLKKTAVGNENSPLLTEKLRESEENNTMLRKISQYKNCVIRVQFPDRHVLQGMFKPIDKIADVKEFTKNYLEIPNKPFHLFIIPPKTKLDVNKTLLELDFVPNALLHFSFDNEKDDATNFIKTEFLNKLTPAVGAFYAATKLRKQQNNPDFQNNGNHQQESNTLDPKRPRN